MSLHLLTDRSAGVLTLTLNRPEKKNALTTEMYSALDGELSNAAGDDSIRVVLIAGNDDFTAGNDLDDFLATPPTDMDAPVMRFLTTLAAFPLPLVAAVNGVAVGIGTTLLLHCELVYAGWQCRFQLPFVNLGLVPEAASSLLLPRLAGYQRAAEMLLLGEAFAVEKAHEIGLVNTICEPGAVLGTARQAAEALARKPRHALRASKALLKGSPDATLKHIQTEARVFQECLRSPEFREAVQAFKDKRSPRFNDE